MNYKKYFITSVLMISIWIIFLYSASVIIDPIGIFNSPVIKGINNYKIHQANYLDTFKTYQIVENQPEVIFIGTSRVYVGWYPSLEGYRDDKVYNLGGSSLSLKDIKQYLHLAYKTCHPKEVYCGLDFFHFGKENCNTNRLGFEQERLDNVRKNIIVRKFSAICDSMKLQKTLYDTVMASRQFPDKEELFIRGWDRLRGSQEINRVEYQHELNSYKQTYNNYSYSPDSMRYLKEIFEEAKLHDVKLYLFFNPVSIDMHKLLISYGHKSELEKIKNEVADIVGIVYDFNFENPYLTKENLFYDSSHYNMKFGELIKRAIKTGKETDYMRIIKK